MKNLILLFLFFVFYTVSNAQTSEFPVTAMEVVTISIANDTTAEGFPKIDSLTIYDAHMFITLSDTLNITEVIINLRDAGSNPRLQKTFIWDVSGSTGSGTSYLRAGYVIDLGLGSFNNLFTYSSDVSIRRSDNSVSTLVYFSR